MLAQKAHASARVGIAVGPAIAHGRTTNYRIAVVVASVVSAVVVAAKSVIISVVVAIVTVIPVVLAVAAIIAPPVAEPVPTAPISGIIGGAAAPLEVESVSFTAALRIFDANHGRAPSRLRIANQLYVAAAIDASESKVNRIAG